MKRIRAAHEGVQVLLFDVPCDAFTVRRATLFLDEIGEMELSLQAKLLRFLQEKSVQRVGQSTTVLVDVRVVAATNQELREQVTIGRFRDDLYYRLNVISIEVPALRERRADIPVLAKHFLDCVAARCGREGLSFTPEALDALVAHGA